MSRWSWITAKAEYPIWQKSNPSRKKQKGAGFGLCFPMLCINETKEISRLGRQRRLLGNWGMTVSQHKRQTLLSLRAHRACALFVLCSALTSESNLVWRWCQHVLSTNLLLGGRSAYAMSTSEFICVPVCFRPGCNEGIAPPPEMVSCLLFLSFQLGARSLHKYQQENTRKCFSSALTSLHLEAGETPSFPAPFHMGYQLALGRKSEEQILLASRERWTWHSWSPSWSSLQRQIRLPWNIRPDKKEPFTDRSGLLLYVSEVESNLSVGESASLCAGGGTAL